MEANQEQQAPEQNQTPATPEVPEFEAPKDPKDWEQWDLFDTTDEYAVYTCRENIDDDWYAAATYHFNFGECKMELVELETDYRYTNALLVQWIEQKFPKL